MVCIAERDDEGNTNIIFAERFTPTYAELGLVPTRKPQTRKKENNMFKEQHPYDPDKEINIPSGNVEILTKDILEALKAQGQADILRDLIIGLCSAHGEGKFNRNSPTAELLIVLVSAMENDISNLRKSQSDYYRVSNEAQAEAEDLKLEIKALQHKLKLARKRK